MALTPPYWGKQTVTVTQCKSVSPGLQCFYLSEWHCRQRTSIWKGSLYFHLWQLGSVASYIPEEGGALSARWGASRLSPALVFNWRGEGEKVKQICKIPVKKAVLSPPQTQNAVPRIPWGMLKEAIFYSWYLKYRSTQLPSWGYLHPTGKADKYVSETYIFRTCLHGNWME